MLYCSNKTKFIKPNIFVVFIYISIFLSTNNYMIIYNEYYKLILIIIISLLQFYNDYRQEKCFNKLYGIKYIILYVNLMIHHFISIYFILSWIFNNKYILYFNIFFILLITLLNIIINLIQKYILNTKMSTGCILTIHKNKLCNDKINKPFYTISKMLNIDKKYEYIIGFIILLINIIKSQLCC